MCRTSLMAAGLLFGFSLTVNQVHAVETCKQKAESIEKKIEIAKKFNNTHEVAGLEQALSSARIHCNDEDLKKELMQDIQRVEKKRQHKQQEIDKLQQRLSDAELNKNSGKIEKYKAKIAKKQQDLSQVQAKLSHLKSLADIK